MLNEAISKMPQVFDVKILLRGQEYFQSGKVLNIRLSDGLCKGRVKGSSGQIYDVHMDLKSWPRTPSRCTCAYQNNCKHAAACLFALRQKEDKLELTSSTDTLDRKLDIWLKNLRAQEQATTHQIERTHELHYMISFDKYALEDRICVELALAKLLKRGGYGKRAKLNTLPDSKKQHFIDDDNDIVAQLLFKCGSPGWFHDLPIRNSDLLRQIIATGRAFFNEDSEPAPIRLGDDKTGTCEWVLSLNGNQHISLMHDNMPVQYLLLDECWYYDEEGVWGRLTTPYTVKQLRHLLNVPPIPLEQAKLLTQKMSASCPELPSPKVFDLHETVVCMPTPVLVLNALSEYEDELNWLDEDDDFDVVYTAKLMFDYEGKLIEHTDPCRVLVEQHHDVLIEYQRDEAFETLKANELHELLELRAPNHWERHRWDLGHPLALILDEFHSYADMHVLYEEVIPEFKNRGWHIQLDSALFEEVISADEVEWVSELHESNHDFFSYQLGILVDGKSVNIVSLVTELIQRYGASELEKISDDECIKIPLEERKSLQVEMGRIKPLIRLLLQFGMRHIDSENNLKMNKYQLLLMQEVELALAATKARWRGAEQLRDQLKQLVDLTHLPEVDPPVGLKAQLRDYQHFSLNWLQFLRQSRWNGVLADDMGLGKTVQTLTHLQYEKEQGRLNAASLIIAPTSLVGNWMAEAKRFTPDLKVLIYHGCERHQDDFSEYDLVISTYGLIYRDKEKFVDYSFYYLILDEAQFIKNARTKTTQIIQQLKAHHRLCLTGTPIENHLGELWSLFHFLMPGLLGDAKQFRLWFRTPIEKHGDLERKDLLTKRVAPFMLRRTKNQVVRELPPKTEMIRTIELDGAQRDLYEAIRMSMEKKVRDAIAKQGLGKSHILLLDALLKLRQVCCDPRLLSLPEATLAHGTSGKLEALMDLLDNLVEEGRRVLVFSQFTSMLKLIEEQLVEKKYPYLKLTGQTQNRQKLVEQFQEGNTPIFLISLKAGGTGLNLTRADTVIHYDPWWNPAVEDQATDRTHRIGQENPVFVYKLITSGTVEEVILGMQERKRQLVEGILAEDSSRAMALTEDDLEQFFIPLTQKKLAN